MGEWQLNDTASPRRITLNVDSAEQKALSTLEGDLLTFYYRNGENAFPDSFPSALSYFDTAQTYQGSSAPGRRVAVNGALPPELCASIAFSRWVSAVVQSDGSVMAIHASR